MPRRDRAGHNRIGASAGVAGAGVGVDDAAGVVDGYKSRHSLPASVHEGKARNRANIILRCMPA